MATEGLRNLEWLDRASGCRYPLQSLASAKDVSGVFELPNEFLASLYLAVPVDLRLNVGTVFISEVVYTPTLVTLTITGSINGTQTNFARADIGLLAIDNQIQAIGYGLSLFEGIGDYSDIRGRVAVARLDNLRLQPIGVYQFNYAGAGIDVDAIRPSIKQVSAIEVEREPGQYVRLSGAVRLRAGTNTRLRVTTEDAQPVVYIDAIDASSFNESLDCDTGSGASIRRINSIRGNSQREITIRESRCLAVSASGSSISLRNRCSEPCASCEEAEAVKAVVDPMAQQIPTLVNFIARLQASVDTQQQNIIMSRGPLQCMTEPTTTAGP